MKWLTNFEEIPNSKPPSVITSMITMVLGFGAQGEGKLRETELLPNQT